MTTPFGRPAPPRSVVLDLPCDRCGDWYLTPRLSLECRKCLGYPPPTPLELPVAVGQ